MTASTRGLGGVVTMDYRTELSKWIEREKCIVEMMYDDRIEMYHTPEQEEHIKKDIELLEKVLKLFDECQEGDC